VSVTFFSSSLLSVLRFLCVGSEKCFLWVNDSQSPSLCMTAVSVNLTNTTVIVPRAHDCSYYVSISITLDCKNTLINGRTNLHRLLTSDISLCSPTLPAPEARDSMEFLLLPLRRVCRMSARFPLNGFPLKLILVTYENLLINPDLLKVCQKYLTLYTWS
jgi:hypothetical protein